MAGRSELVRAFVMDVIADDYEDFDRICAGVNDLAQRCGITICDAEVRQALVDLLEQGLGRAYRLTAYGPAIEFHAAPPLDDIAALHYWLTPAGIEAQTADYKEWPFNIDGSLRSGWSPPLE